MREGRTMGKKIGGRWRDMLLHCYEKITGKDWVSR